MQRGLRWVGAVAAATLLAGCSISFGASGTPTSPPPTGQPPTSEAPTSAPPTSAPPLEVPTGSLPTPTSSGDRLTTSTKTITGAYEKANWKITIPTFAGPSVAAEVNRRVEAAVGDLVAQTKKYARDDQGAKRTMQGTGKVITNDGRTAQVLITYSDYVEGAAHPSDYVTTTVVDVRRSRPVRFSDVVQNPPEGMRYLATKIKKIAADQGEDVTEPDGLSAKLANWAAWQTDTTGMIFVFGDYQLGGLGLRTYTVPWSQAKLILSGYGEKLLLPS